MSSATTATSTAMPTKPTSANGTAAGTTITVTASIIVETESFSAITAVPCTGSMGTTPTLRSTRSLRCENGFETGRHRLRYRNTLCFK